MKEKISNTLRIVVLSLILSATIGYALADWAPPAGTPPFNNVPPPINVGPATQQKVGNLFLDNFLGVNDVSITNRLGIGTYPATEKLDVNGNIKANGKITPGFAVGQGLCLSDGCKTSWLPGDNLGNHTATMNLNMGTNRINNVVDPGSSQDAATKNYVDTRPGDHLGDRNARNGRITNVVNPTNPQDAATKNYVDNKSLSCRTVRVSVWGNTATANCAADEIVTGGGWGSFCGENMDQSRPSGNGWVATDSSRTGTYPDGVCADSRLTYDGNSNLDVVARCCKIIP